MNHLKRQAQPGTYLSQGEQKQQPHVELKLTVDDLTVIDRMRRLTFGRIEKLLVRNGHPVIGTDTLVLQLVKDNERRGGAKAALTRRAAPHARHLAFIEECRTRGYGIVERVDVADGIPINWSRN